jgi:hypothetical protein
MSSLWATRLFRAGFLLPALPVSAGASMPIPDPILFAEI